MLLHSTTVNYSSNANNLQSHNCQDANFGRKLILGCKTPNTPPFNKDFFQIVQQNQSPLPEPWERLKTGLHTAIVDLIKELQESRGPLRPTLEADNCCFDRSKVDLGIPKTLHEEYREIDQSLRSKELDCWKKAGDNLYEAHKEEIDTLNKNIEQISPEDPEFIDEIIKMNKFLGRGTEMKMNIESGRIRDLAKDNESVIFLFNHPAPPNDLCLTFGFISKLYEKYSQAGLAKTCPRPKYLLTQRIVEAMPEKLRGPFQKVQGVGVDAGTYPTPERAGRNGEIMQNLVDGFEQGQNHIFIFPEGGRARYQNIPLEERFQYGIGKIATKILEDVGEVKVVNVGMDYKNGVGAVHIGKPVIFKIGENGEILTNKGNFQKGGKTTTPNRFYSQLSCSCDTEFQPLKIQGTTPQLLNSMTKEESRQNQMLASRLIAGVMCDNMSICISKAQKMLTKE